LVAVVCSRVGSKVLVFWFHREGVQGRGKAARWIAESASRVKREIQGGSNMTGTDFCVNKPHCAAAVRP